MSERRLDVIYCDDIREEVGSKISLMGIYGSEMRVPEFPVTLPKLCVCLRIHTPIAHPLVRAEVVLLRDGTPFFNADMSPPADVISRLRSDMARRAPEDIENAWISMHPMIVLAPFEVSAACKIGARVRTEEEELRGPALTISLIDP